MKNQKSIPVRLKGVGDSLWITLDPAQSVDLLKKELKRIFERLKHLAINARVIIDAGEQKGHDNLIKDLGSFLKDAFDVGSVTGPPQKRSVSEEKVRKRDMGTSWNRYRNDALVLYGRVRSGQKINAKRHLIILGDVNPGGEVIAGGDILILGNLHGKAMAGHPNNEEAIILAIDFRPIQIQIGGYVAAGLPSSPGKKIEFARMENDTILVEDYLKANPFSRLPWPQVR